jgi:hypothetical protein
MAGIFKNISNSGGAIFRNTSNSGRGLFYGDGYIPPPETTTTTTTSTTTTTTTSEYTTTTTTTQAPPVTFTLSYSNIDGATACSNYPTIDTTVYYAAPGSTLSNDTTIYSDYNLTTLVSNGYYSNGVDYWIVAASSGILNNQTSCTPTTTTTTTTTSTTTTTTTAAPTYPRWSVTACPGSTQGPTVVAVGLEVGSVYSGPNGCFTVNSAFGTSTSSPGTYTLVADCNAAQCPQI